MGIEIREISKKLALWHTPTFCPIMTHDDLEPILYSVGFISLPANAPSTSTNEKQPSSPLTAPSADVQWKEYDFPSAAAAVAAVSGVHPPRPRLPFPMIYGLHLIAYRAFLSALECYIDPSDVYDLFHVRAMPIAPMPNEEFEKAYRPMKDVDIDNDGKIYVYRRGTFHHYMLAAMERIDETEEEDDDDHRIIRSGRSRRAADQSIMVSLDNLLPCSYNTSPFLEI